MFSRLAAPICVMALLLTVWTTIGFNYDALAQSSEAGQDYFIKPILSSNAIVVEPNYGHFYNPNPEIEGDASGEVLYRSLEDLQATYAIKGTKMVRYERKGKVIPNLYVYVDSPNLETASFSFQNRDALAGNLGL